MQPTLFDPKDNTKSAVDKKQSKSGEKSHRPVGGPPNEIHGCPGCGMFSFEPVKPKSR